MTQYVILHAWVLHGLSKEKNKRKINIRGNSKEKGGTDHTLALRGKAVLGAVSVFNKKWTLTFCF